VLFAAYKLRMSYLAFPTDRLLPSDRTVPAPFAQDECQELMSLLRSFGSEQETGFQAIVHSRIVARILLRLGQNLMLSPPFLISNLTPYSPMASAILPS
jgi:hypothetical protein